VDTQESSREDYCPSTGATAFTAGASTFGATGATVFTSQDGFSSCAAQQEFAAERNEVADTTTAINIDNTNFIRSPLRFISGLVCTNFPNIIQEVNTYF
jgi:hypothetical protein